MTAFTFHHLGIACRDLDRSTEQQRQLGYAPEGADFVDPVQGVRGRFLVGGGPRLELLQALPSRSVLDPWLTGGDRIYHQAFTVPDVDEALKGLMAGGARIVVAPVPAVAFAGRRIAFVLLRTMAMVEVIDS